MRINNCLFFICIIALFLPSNFVHGAAHGNGTPLALGVKQVRVLLFSEYQTINFLLFSYQGAISIKSKEHTLHYREGETGFGVKVDRNRVILSRNGKTYSSEKWEISAMDGSAIRMLHPDAGWRYYKGSITITPYPGGRMRLINTVGLEDYVASTVGSEMNFENDEALKVQAVIARTYALWNISLNKRRDYEITDHYMNQSYLGELILKPQYRRAAEATAGEIIMWSDRLILAVYHSTCGGRTTSNENVWAGLKLPYLSSVTDLKACDLSPHFEWETEIAATDLHHILNNGTKYPVDWIEVNETDIFGRITSLMVGSGEKKHQLSINMFRLFVNGKMGETAIRSSNFTMEKSGDYYIFKGNGLGHGVGLCQWGANGLAESSWNYKDIIRFYYNGSDIINYSELNGSGYVLANFR